MILIDAHIVRAKGGGGSSGAVQFPDYMEDRHENWLGTTSVTTSVSQLINTGHGTNPLEDLSYEDPGTRETALDAEMTAFDTYAKAGDADADYSAAVAEAAAEVDTEGVLQEIDITNLVEASRAESFETVQAGVLAALEAIDDGRVYQAVQSFVNARRKERASNRARYKANMSNLSAERGSAYAIGLALLEMDFERQTSEYQTQLSNEMYQAGLRMFVASFTTELQARVGAKSQEKQTRDSILSQGIQLHLGYQQFLHELRKNLVVMRGEVNRLNFVMDSEYVANTADLNWKYASWDWNVYANATAVLGGIGGGTYVPEGPSKTGSTIGGAMTGAAIGTAIAPGVGTAVGAVVGGLAGFFG